MKTTTYNRSGGETNSGVVDDGKIMDGGMLRGVLSSTALLLALSLGACQTPNIQPAGGASGRTGDAEGGGNGVDSNVTLAQPGGTAINNPVRNEDRTSSAQTAPVFQLVLTPGSVADSDPLAKALAKRLNEAEPEAWDALYAKLEARLDKLHEMNDGRFPALAHAGLYVVNIMSNGESVQKLDAETVKAAGEGLKAAVMASVEAAKQ